jgi:hypothetical protein
MTKQSTKELIAAYREAMNYMDYMVNGNVCSICGTRYQGYGNNAQPINKDRCCDDCNSLVIARRIQSGAAR